MKALSMKIITSGRNSMKVESKQMQVIVRPQVLFRC